MKIKITSSNLTLSSIKIPVLEICVSQGVYGSWDMECKRQFFFFFFWILDHFLPFYLYDNLKNQNFEKAKKILGDTHCSCNTTYDRCHFYFSFWVIFCYFTHMCTINDIWWHIWCMVPEIWSVTDRNFGHFGPFFALLPP